MTALPDHKREGEGTIDPLLIAMQNEGIISLAPGIREGGGEEAKQGFVTMIEEFDNGFVAHGLMGLVATDRTRNGAIEKLRKLTIRQVDGPEHASGIVATPLATGAPHHFTDEQILSACSDEATKQAIYHHLHRMTREEKDALYGAINKLALRASEVKR